MQKVLLNKIIAKNAYKVITLNQTHSCANDAIFSIQIYMSEIQEDCKLFVNQAKMLQLWFASISNALI